MVTKFNYQKISKSFYPHYITNNKVFFKYFKYYNNKNLNKNMSLFCSSYKFNFNNFIDNGMFRNDIIYLNYLF